MSYAKMFLLLVSLSATVIGCWSGEKIIKPQSLVAKANQGDFEVEKFLINGKPADEMLSASPNEELKITLTFKRNKEYNPPHNVCGSIVAISNETKDLAKGSQTVLSQAKIPTESALGTKTVEMKLFAPKAELHNFLANHTQGCFFQLIIAENQSEIVSKRIEFVVPDR